jgi:YHS domain-containing protein
MIVWRKMWRSGRVRNVETTLAPSTIAIPRQRGAFEEHLKMATDPVCHMSVDEKSAAGKSEYKGKTYYFCAPACKVKFDASPEQYAK